MRPFYIFSHMIVKNEIYNLTVFAKKHEVILPSTYILHSPFRVWDSKKRRYDNIELQENITGVFLKRAASLGNLCRVFLFRWLLCHLGNN